MHSDILKLSYPSFTPFIYPREGDGQKWQRIRCVWNEKESERQHKIAFAINIETKEIYLDCRKRKIWAKCVVLTLLRPLHTIILRTAYHILFPVSLVREISLGISFGKKKKLPTQKIINLVALKVSHSIQDIFRSPLYGTILTVISLAGVLIGPFAPQKLYDIRAFYGKVERSLNRKMRLCFWSLAPCFSPISNLSKLQKDARGFDDTDYEHRNGQTKGSSNLARALIRDFRSIRCNPFNGCSRLGPQETYTSAAFVP